MSTLNGQVTCTLASNVQNIRTPVGRNIDSCSRKIFLSFLYLKITFRYIYLLNAKLKMQGIV